MWKELARGLLDLVYPPVCEVCGRLESALCSECQSQWRAPLRDLEPSGPLAGAAAVGYHESTLREAVLKLKYHGRLSLVAPLSEQVAQLVRNRPDWSPEAITYVPMHPWRQWLRGYNQAEELARGTARELGLPLVRLIRRRVPSRPQVGLSLEDRLRNLAGAFVAIQPSRKVIMPHRLLLIDDVRTTGATVMECASVLGAGGVDQIWAATVTYEP